MGTGKLTKNVKEPQIMLFRNVYKVLSSERIFLKEVQNVCREAQFDLVA